MKIPTLNERERQEMFTQILVKQLYEAATFILKKLEPQALKEYNEERTRHSAEQFRTAKKDDPTSFAIAQATTSKNIFGSKVEVLKSKDESVTLNIKECARLRTTLELTKEGFPMTRTWYCGLCMNGYYKKVAEKLGLKIEAKLTDKGCKMQIRKI